MDAAAWAALAEKWEPDHDAIDRILIGVLARADQSTVAQAVRARMLAEARRVLATHRPDRAGRCSVHGDSLSEIPYPCWAVQIARLITAEPGGAVP